MKHKLYTVLAIFSTLAIKTQTVQSSCSAPDSIIQYYKEDADRITVKRFYQLNYTYKDSIKIPTSYSDTILRALVAVYNATALPARNAVISTYNIHTFYNPSLKNINVFADSTMPWMQQLKQNNIPTGNSQIDNLLANYSLTVQNYFNWFGIFSYHQVTFVSPKNLNLGPLVNTFTTIPNVAYAELPSVMGDGSTITATVTPNYVDLTYKLAWGDCPAGCIYSHFWVFRVYYDCKVESLSDFGYPIPILQTPAISIVGSRCTNSVITVKVTNANTYFLNNQPITGPQFTLSSVVPATITVAAYNSSVFPIATTSAGVTFTIADCRTNLTAISKKEVIKDISIAPNPADGYLTIYGFSKEIAGNKVELTIYNSIGQIVFREKLENQTEVPIRISTSNFEAGIYILSVTSPEKEAISQKILVSH